MLIIIGIATIIIGETIKKPMVSIGGFAVSILGILSAL